MKLRTIAFGLALACLAPLAALAQPTAPYGFDWVGSGRTCVIGERCCGVHRTPAGGSSRPVTTWDPEAYPGSTAHYHYTPREFRAVVGSCTSALNPAHPSTSIRRELF